LHEKASFIGYNNCVLEFFFQFVFFSQFVVTKQHFNAWIVVKGIFENFDEFNDVFECFILFDRIIGMQGA